MTDEVKAEETDQLDLGETGADTPAAEIARLQAETARLQEENARLSRERAELADLARRLQADFDNFRRRTREEAAELKRVAASGVVLDLLPALDNLERALGAGSSQSDPLYQGVALTREQLVAALVRGGLEPVPATGEAFDPRVHEAMERLPGEAGGEDGELIVAEELRRGYLFGGKLLRPSLVKVVPKGRRD